MAGIMDTIGLLAVVVFAAPVALYGVEQLVAGRPVLGAGLLLVAGLMVAVPRVVTTPGDLPGAVVQRVVGTVAKTEDEE